MQPHASDAHVRFRLLFSCQTTEMSEHRIHLLFLYNKIGNDEYFKSIST